MDINYQEAEFIKICLRQKIIGYEMMKKQVDTAGTVSAIASFLGKEMSDEEADLAINMLRSEIDTCNQIIDKINHEYGL